MRLVLFVLPFLFVLGCGSAQQAIEPPLPADATIGDLIVALERDGYIADAGPFRLAPLLDVAGHELRFRRGGALHVFEYDTAQEAAADVGDLGVVTAPTSATVYRSGRLAVVYFGTDPGLQLTLSQLLGRAVL